MRTRSASCRAASAASALAAGIALLALAGCASVHDPYREAPAQAQLAANDAVGACLRRFAQFDARVQAAGVRDVEAAIVPGFPFLRADRGTLAAQPKDAAPGALAPAKIAQMSALDAQARAVEAANARIGAAELAALEACRPALLASLADPSAALAAAQPPAAYSSIARVVGLYPLTQVPFALGAASWQSGVRSAYATPFPELPVAGERLRYVPGAAGAGALAGVLPADPATAAGLQRPVLTAERAWSLLAAHAPVLVVDTVDRNNRFGTVAWRQSADRLFLTVDDAAPAAYVRVAWGEIGGTPLLQLVYAWWFAARPSRGGVDLAAGPLDALVWRVTLDRAGRPLVYDAMHGDGSAHLFFPTERVRARPAPRAGEGPLDQSLFAPQVVRAPGGGERVIVFIGADHQIQRVAVDAVPQAPGIVYALQDADRLRVLPLPAAAGGGTRSIYGPDGLVPGSARGERWLLWPMGIPSAGQPRQWGHHATALVGRRVFDDPQLLERYFTLAPGAE